MKNDGAVSLWTFDGDAFDENSRALIVPEGEPPIIMDEVGDNVATLITDHATYLGYRMGMPSLVAYEPQDQYSISFGYYGNIPQHPQGYPQSYLDIPNSSTYEFTDNGSFSVEFIIRMTNPGASGTYPIFNKSGTISIDLVFGGLSQIRIIDPSGNTTYINTFTGYTGGSLYSTIFHFIYTWGVVEVEDGIFLATARVMINTAIIYENTYTYYDSPPITSTTSSINIGGNSSSRWKSRLDLDQIAIYDRALSVSEIIRHVCKIQPYHDLLKSDGATNIWPMDDIDHISDFNIYPYFRINDRNLYGRIRSNFKISTRTRKYL